MSRDEPPRELDNVDAWRTPTASQAAGLTLAAARRMIAAAEDMARQLRVAMSIAVVDAGDQLVAFARMDGADLVTVRLARDKAFSALMNRMPTRDLAPLVQPGAEFYGYDSLAGGRMIVFAGGMPLERGGVLVGAVGVSGGSADEDQQAADAAAAALEPG
ncbi:MAG TPA: heme-binding protein [Candidatus Limnocylindria bacterium]